MTRSRDLKRRSAALASLFVIGYHATFLHMLLVPHSMCWEHYEVVEGSGTLPSAAPTDRAIEQPGARRILETSAAAAERQHEHCVLASVARSRVFAVSSIGAADTILPVEQQVVAGDHRASPPVPFPLYLLAPAHSPPVA